MTIEEQYRRMKQRTDNYQRNATKIVAKLEKRVAELEVENANLQQKYDALRKVEDMTAQLMLEQDKAQELADMIKNNGVSGRQAIREGRK